MKFLKNRLVIGCICIILAFALGFIGVPFITKVTSDKIQVVVASKDISKGALLTEDMFRIVEMSVGDLPYMRSELYSAISGKNDECIFNVNASASHYAAVEISANDFISRKKVTDEIPYKDKELRDLADDEYAVSIAVSSLDASVSGKIRANDVVTLLIVGGNNAETKASVFDQLKYMEVISVASRDGVDVKTDTSEELPTYVTLRCNLEQAQILAQLNADYKIHLAFAAHSSSDRAAALLQSQKEYFIERAKQEAEAAALAEAAEAEAEQDEIEQEEIILMEGAQQ